MHVRACQARCREHAAAAAGKSLTMRISGQGIVDEGLQKAVDGGHKVTHCLVYHHRDCMPQSEVPWTTDRDSWWHDCVDGQAATCDVTWLDAEAPLFKVVVLPSC